MPLLNILNFERVSVVTENGSLKVEPTFILPKLLNDDQLDSLLKTAYDNTDIIFDPDSRIKTITIEINTSSSNQQFDIIAQAQDKLNIETNNTNFNTSGEGTNKLILNLTDEQFSNQTLAENQSQIVEVLRSVKYSNEAEISNLVSGYRDVKIDRRMDMWMYGRMDVWMYGHGCGRGCMCVDKERPTGNVMDVGMDTAACMCG